MVRMSIVIFAAGIAAGAAGLVAQGLPEPLAPGLSYKDQTTIQAPVDFVRGFKALNVDSSANAVIEIPSTMPRGTVAKVRIIGVMKFDDSGKRDDRLIAVTDGTNFAAMASLGELNARYHGVTLILETWFYNYKGTGSMVFLGFGEAGEAKSRLDAAARVFR
jgi:hypothetical protein